MRQKVSTVRSSAAAGIADDAENPAVDGALMLAEERFEGIEIALPEPIEYASIARQSLAVPARASDFPF